MIVIVTICHSPPAVYTPAPHTSRHDLSSSFQIVILPIFARS